MDLGAGHWIERGNIIIFVCGPYGTGTDSLRMLAKAVCNTFRGLPSRNPYYENASIGSGGNSDPGMQGSYYVIPVTVAFCFED